MDRDQATPKEMDRGRLRQQEAVGDKKKELGENFEDVWYIHAVASRLVPFWFHKLGFANLKFKYHSFVWLV
jgi:hypothetical protein